MEKFSQMVTVVDDFVWGPVMLLLLVGTGILLTIRTRFLPWRNLGFALKSTLSKEARTTKRGQGDVSPFSALTTALAATIGTGNIVGVATAMVSGGPGALVWMWISALFGMSSKFAECMLAIKYREVNEKGEMSGGPMYTMSKAFRWKRFGRAMGWLFALFAVIASFGIGNMTQGNSIASALNTTFQIPMHTTGVVITILAFIIIVGGIQSISKVSSVVVPLMAICYVIFGVLVILVNIKNLPSGVVMIVSMAFNVKAVSGGALGTVVASLMSAMRYGVARGVFSNEAGMGSAAITAAAATTDHPVRQGYINMTGTFWDTIVVCTITGLAIASSGVLGSTSLLYEGQYVVSNDKMIVSYVDEEGESMERTYTIQIKGDGLGDEEKRKDKNCNLDYNFIKSHNVSVTLTSKDTTVSLVPYDGPVKHVASGVVPAQIKNGNILGTWAGEDKNVYNWKEDGRTQVDTLLKGSSLTIAAFTSALKKPGGWLVSISIALFAFSTILGWEYHGEKAWEYLFHTHKYNMIYRIVFSLVAYVGATQTLDLVWNFSDIANALMAIPNLICLLLLSREVSRDIKDFQKVIERERKTK